jgi:hypothetical protein
MLDEEDYKKLVIKPKITESTETLSNLVKEIIKDDEKANYPHPIGHDTYLKESRTYSLLANQVVGCENF